MIVNQIQEGWEIINQPAHGLLAAQLALAFPESAFPQGLRMATIAAIQDHDDRPSVYEQHTYVTKIGAPRDFTLLEMNASERYEQVKQAVHSAYQKSSWVGLLISRHFDFLYEGQKVKKRLTKFLKQQKKERGKILRQLNIKKSVLEDTYQIMRFCDRCSLILCRGQIPAMGRKLEILTDQQGDRYDIFRSEEERKLYIDPWPFDEASVSVSAELRVLDQLSFKNDQALHQALEKAVPNYRKWTLNKP